MKIKYKLILMFVSITIISILPLSIFILDRQEKDKIDIIVKQGEMYSRLIVNSAENILLMNSGNISSSKVDIKEMLDIFFSNQHKEIIYADVVLLSSNEKLNGIILAAVSSTENNSIKMSGTGKSLPKQLNRIREKLKKNNYFSENSYKSNLGFFAAGSFTGSNPLCLGRLYYSKKMILAPLEKTRGIIYIAVVVAIVSVILLGLFFSNIISMPIAHLTRGVELIELGDLGHEIKVRSKDEIGKLTTTFNHMVKMLKMQIFELVNTNRELKRLDVLKDEFLANISHELRSPLNGIIGIAESLKDGVAGPQDKESIYNLSLIINSGRRLSILVNDILDFSKLKNFDITLNLENINFYSIVQISLSVLNPLIKKKNIEVKNSLDINNTIVYGDENKLQQIMINLLDNALKFTDEGEITIRSEINPENSDQLIVIVSDSGVGISEDRISEVFNSFEQGNGADSRIYGGTGLGLSITKHLVELHGGNIWVQSIPGEGTSFSFSLNIAKGKEHHTEKENEILVKPVFDMKIEDFKPGEHRITDTVISENRNRTIIVVDDDPVNVQVLVNFLNLEGYNVESAMDAMEVFARLDKGEVPDLILLDVMLPVITGYDACRVIRESYSQYELPIVMLTAKSKPSDMVIGIECGANDYLPKPINREVLMARVNSLISMKKSAIEHEELSVLKRDLQIAHKIQRSLLPIELPVDEQFKIDVKYEAMYELGGDFYDVSFKDNKLAFFLADVSGHGIPAALICSMLKITNHIHREFEYSPGLFFENINSTMYDFLSDQFITVAYIYIDFKTGKLYHSNAGHWPVVIWRSKDNLLIEKKAKGMPMGWVKDESYGTVEDEIKEGDRIVIFTDGLLEVKNSDGEMYSEEKFYQLIKSGDNFTADEFSEYIINSIKDWSGMSENDKFDDDATFVVIDIK